MIAFEKYLLDNGFELFEGSLKDFSTYDNCSRSYKNKDGKKCMVGLYAKPTRIGILSPCIVLPGEISQFTHVPVEKDFEEILTQILA
jgi:hypothetical protein